MFDGTYLFGDVNSKTGVRDVFLHVRTDVQAARTRASLYELYKHADFLAALFHAPCWKMRFGDEAPEYDALSDEEFRKTAHEINRRARQIGLRSHFEETWH